MFASPIHVTIRLFHASLFSNIAIKSKFLGDDHGNRAARGKFINMSSSFETDITTGLPVKFCTVIRIVVTSVPITHVKRGSQGCVTGSPVKLVDSATRSGQVINISNAFLL